MFSDCVREMYFSVFRLIKFFQIKFIHKKELILFFIIIKTGIVNGYAGNTFQLISQSDNHFDLVY